MPVTPQKLRELTERMQALGISPADSQEHFVRGSARAGSSRCAA